jgi:hypothetical protein
VFVLGKPFQPSPMFVSKALRVELSGVPLVYALALIISHRLVWKNLPGTNTLAYYEHS